MTSAKHKYGYEKEQSLHYRQKKAKVIDDHTEEPQSSQEIDRFVAKILNALHTIR